MNWTDCMNWLSWPSWPDCTNWTGCLTYEPSSIAALCLVCLTGYISIRTWRTADLAWKYTPICISMLTCWRYVLFRDVTQLVQYYWFDLLVSIVQLDTLMVVHHIVTLYLLAFCPDDPDYAIIQKVIYGIKCGDIVMHYTNITRGLQLKTTKMLLVSQLLANVYTVIAGLWFRLYCIVAAMPINDLFGNIVAAALVYMNVFWLWKFAKNASKIVKTLKTLKTQ